MRKAQIAVASSFALLAGCSVPKPWLRVQLDDIPVDQVARIDALPEHTTETLGATPYTDLGAVDGISCKRSSRELASWEDAVRRTRFKALQKGGNAIKDLECDEPKGRSLSTLCYESIRCTAKAIQTGR